MLSSARSKTGAPITTGFNESASRIQKKRNASKKQNARHTHNDRQGYLDHDHLSAVPVFGVNFSGGISHGLNGSNGFNPLNPFNP
jgi:hypothetical protein